MSRQSAICMRKKLARHDRADVGYCASQPLWGRCPTGSQRSVTTREQRAAGRISKTGGCSSCWGLGRGAEKIGGGGRGRGRERPQRKRRRLCSVGWKVYYRKGLGGGFLDPVEGTGGDKVRRGRWPSGWLRGTGDPKSLLVA